MARTVSIGRQDFEKMRVNNNFYVDKTHFIRQWWEAEDDVTLEPRETLITLPWSEESTHPLDGTIIEFKVQEDDEKELADTTARALQQIEEKNYQASLVAKGIPEARIRKYGFAFCGKRVLIGAA